jgi:hypothetical protein
MSCCPMGWSTCFCWIHDTDLGRSSECPGKCQSLISFVPPSKCSSSLHWRCRPSLAYPLSPLFRPGSHISSRQRRDVTHRGIASILSFSSSLAWSETASTPRFGHDGSRAVGGLKGNETKILEGNLSQFTLCNTNPT